MRFARPTSFIYLGLALVVCFECAAQSLPSASSTEQVPSATPQAQTIFTQRSTVGSGSPLSANGQLAQPALPSADWIIQALQSNDELLVEVKQYVADKLTQAGQPTNANEISDDQLFQQIESNQTLQTQLANVLRAHGTTAPSPSTQRQSVVSGDVQGDVEAGSDLQMQDGSLLTATQQGMRVPGLGLPYAGSTRYPQTALEAEPRNDTEKIPSVIHRQTPYNLRSLRDLYTQLPEPPQELKRFGSALFVRRTSFRPLDPAESNAPLDVPLGPDYVLGAGDVLNISVWGSVSQTINRTVDRDGRISLPDGGSFDVAGQTLAKAEDEIRATLRRQYRDANVAVTVSHVRTVRVYVTGDVQRPGGYDISSLATPISALIAAGGPTARGSLRTAKHLRSGRLIETVDLYGLMLHGVQASLAHFESGDTLLVPVVGPQITVVGAVRRPAIYEMLPSAESLSAVLEDAGGTTAAASLDRITIDRIANDGHRETITVPSADLKTFALRDEDRVTIPAILPYSQRVVYLQGHVARPGRIPFVDGMRISGALHSYQDMLPEPADRGEIVRLVPPDLHAETIEFNVPEVMAGNGDISLQPLDTVRIFGRYEADSPTVEVHGEVLRPGRYPLSAGMTAAELVRMAGGFKRDALHTSADLVSYTMPNSDTVHGDFREVRIGDAVDRSDRSADVPLKAGDVLTIHQLSGWSDISQSVTLDGQLRFPGSYGFRQGERLSSVLQRAGGFRDTAYPEGAVLIREQVKELEQKSRDELIRQIETSSASARLSPTLAAGDAGQRLELIKAQQSEVLDQLRSHPPTGRMVIHIGSDISAWANTEADVELRPGDVLTVPKRPGFVLVQGQVYNPTALSFTAGRTAGWYLSRAGGANSTANRKDVFVIRANGTVIGRHSGGFFGSDVLSTKLNPGDVVVMPQKVIGKSLFWRNLLTTAQLASSVAITAAVAAL